jgi:drug/metabolite transporter (DMT)-like permease
VLVISGVIGIAIADTLLFVALDLIGVGLMTIVDCTYAPCVLAFSWLLLTETITPIHIAGAGLIFAGVFLSTRHEPPPGRTRGQLIAGIAIGATAIACIAFGIVYVKPVLENVPVLWATMVRLVSAMIPLTIVAMLIPRHRADLLAMWRPSPVWRAAIPASVLGNYMSLVLWVAGFKYAPASINGILNQTSIIFALVFATIFLKEPLTRKKIIAVSMAFSGALVVVVYDHFTDS